MIEPYGPHVVERKRGDERFKEQDRLMDLCVSDFWQWACSDLITNSMRGVLAEFIVANALGLTDGTRVEWAAWDMKTPAGLKIEVKSAAYVQSWHQQSLSNIIFGISPTYGWDAETGNISQEQVRQADVYVFCLLHHREKQSVDPLNLDQWEFYILPTRELNACAALQKSISLSSLLKMGPSKVRYGDIRAAIETITGSDLTSIK